MLVPWRLYKNAANLVQAVIIVGVYSPDRQNNAARGVCLNGMLIVLLADV
ncbi:MULTISPECIES: hypothetical protein [Snodgrassella]|nr:MULTISPECIES: hypothetical protein [Snodgrassella]NUE66203.1 hypothetical protein [Snodgrassella sp. ESL0253]